MNFLIKYQYVILYFSGAFFSFFAMISYIKFGSSLVGGKKKLDSPEEFFGGFDNDDLEALLEGSFEVSESDEVFKASGPNEQAPGEFSFISRGIEIEIKEPDVATASVQKKVGGDQPPRDGE